MSEGLSNDKLVKRDKEGNTVFKWVLDGPLLTMTRADEIILGVTLNVKDQNKYSVWCLDETEEAKKSIISEQIKQISCIEKAVYWLTQEAKLYCCGVGLQQKLIGNFTQTTTNFAVSFDGLYTVIMDLATRNQAIITIFNNGES